MPSELSGRDIADIFVTWTAALGVFSYVAYLHRGRIRSTLEKRTLFLLYCAGTLFLFRGFFWRITNRYLLRSFHPLAVFYFMGLFLLPVGFCYGLYLVWLERMCAIDVAAGQSVLCALFIITGLQFLLFAMLFDMQESA